MLHDIIFTYIYRAAISPSLIYHNNLYLARKYAQIVVLGHCMFLKAHSFHQATLSENCRFLVQIMSMDKYWFLFSCHMEAIVQNIQYNFFKTIQQKYYNFLLAFHILPQYNIKDTVSKEVTRRRLSFHDFALSFLKNHRDHLCCKGCLMQGPGPTEATAPSSVDWPSLAFSS